jgi:hypothetical protein
MANHTFLIEAENQMPIQRNEEPAIALAAGRNCIPVFWYSLFDESCIVTNKVLLQGGKLENYPYLVTSLNDARKRLSARHLLLESLLPEKIKAITDKWFGFVNSLNLPFVHADAAELWMMLGDDSFQSHIKNCMRAYDVRAPHELKESELWAEMLDVAQVDIANAGDNKIAYKLAGYTWGGKPVPWGN